MRRAQTAEGVVQAQLMQLLGGLSEEDFLSMRRHFGDRAELGGTLSRSHVPVLWLRQSEHALKELELHFPRITRRFAI